MTYIIVSSSLNPDSKSRILAQELAQQISDSEVVDMRDYPLPLCDGGSAYEDENVTKLNAKFASASGILLCTPIYNFTCNSVLKNLIELTGRSWTDKVVGFACAAGGHSSYMSIMSVASSLMLDFRCVIVPRFLYATGDAFADGKVSDEKIKERLDGLAQEFVRMSTALKG